MRPFFALVEREYWEHKCAFYVLHKRLSFLMVVIAVGVFFLSDHSHLTIYGLPDRSVNITAFISYFFTGLSLPFILLLWVSLFNYFAEALYLDRKDGSIVFWRSFPISDISIVLSKVAAGLIVAPLCAWVCFVLTAMVILVVLTVLLMIHPIISWQLLWHPLLLSRVGL